jgi:hypothetical protein
MKNENTINNLANFIKSYSKSIFSCLIISAALILNSCVDFEEPGLINNPPYPITDDPSITAIDPPNVALGGVREISISGQNLGVKNGTDTDWVYIGGTRAVIKDIINNQTIVLYRPQLPSSRYDVRIYVSVTAPQAIDTSTNFEYMLESPGQVVGNYGTVFSELMALDFDNQENIYIASNRAVYRNDPTGISFSQILTTQNLPVAYRRITDARFGPGTPGLNLYTANGTNIINRVRVDTASTSTRPIAVDTLPAPVIKLEFNENGDLYAGGNDGIFLVNGGPQSLGFAGLNIKTIRIFNGYMYVADSLNVWKSPISSDGSLGVSEPLVNISGNPDLSGCLISSIELDIDGSIYICLRNHPQYSLFFRESDGSITPYYYDQNILPRTVEQLTFGKDGHLYLISNSLRVGSQWEAGRVFRMNLNRNGAPYYGRQFLN